MRITVFLPSEDEWYKAAYYHAPSTSYFDYPAGSNTQTTCAAPTATPNHANCGPASGDFTDVGSYPGSPSPYGTFDQGGNVWEWNETIIGLGRGVRGGACCNPIPEFSSPANLAAAVRLNNDPLAEETLVGFRVAPEPGAMIQLVSGIAALLGLALGRRR
jgi:formylglycine-generating enzyme required for sulfatase activity